MGTSGKAFDTSLLMAFLQDDLTRASQARTFIMISKICQVDKSNGLVECCAYLVASSNEFFRILRAEGLFLKGHRREAALHAGCEMNAL